MRYPRFFSLALLVVGLVMVFSLSGLAAANEYGAQGTIPGVTFTGGDGSYKRVVRGGILLGISADFPWTYLDQKTKQYDGVDVSIFKEVTRRLGITKVTYQIMPYDGLIPALQSKRIDVIVDNIHENPKRLVVIDFTGPSYFYGSAVSTQKGNPKKIITWESLSGKTLGAIRGSIGQTMAEDRKDLKEVKHYSSSDAQFADLAAGRVDAVLNDDVKMIQFIKAHPGINMELSAAVLPPKVQVGYAGYGIRKVDVDLNHASSRAIEEMRADGTIMNILVQWGLPARNLFNFQVPAK